MSGEVGRVWHFELTGDFLPVIAGNSNQCPIQFSRLGKGERCPVLKVHVYAGRVFSVEVSHCLKTFHMFCI